MARQSPDGSGAPEPDSSNVQVSRRTLLRSGAAAIGGALAAGPAHAAAKQTSTSGTAGRAFRAYVRSGARASVEQLRLLPIQPRQVVVRMQASQVCYRSSGRCSMTRAWWAWPPP